MIAHAHSGPQSHSPASVLAQLRHQLSHLACDPGHPGPVCVPPTGTAQALPGSAPDDRFEALDAPQYIIRHSVYPKRGENQRSGVCRYTGGYSETVTSWRLSRAKMWFEPTFWDSKSRKINRSVCIFDDTHDCPTTVYYTALRVSKTWRKPTFWGIQIYTEPQTVPPKKNAYGKQCRRVQQIPCHAVLSSLRLQSYAHSDPNNRHNDKPTLGRTTICVHHRKSVPEQRGLRTHSEDASEIKEAQTSP